MSYVWLFLVVSLLLNGLLFFMVRRSMGRLLEFDELFDLFVHDIETNVKYFEKLLNSPLFSNAPEYLTAHRNMQIIARRLAEYSNRMFELTNREQKKEERLPPPKVV